MTRSKSKVPACSKAKIRKIVNEFRILLKIADVEYIEIINLCEFVMPQIFPKFELHISPKYTLADDHARTYPDQSIIEIREDIYQGACEGKGRDRFTLAHEVGHLLLHQNVPFSYRDVSTPYPIYQDAEWQADYFAGSFLMPHHLVVNYSQEKEIMLAFGVSAQAANTRLSQIKNE